MRRIVLAGTLSVGLAAGVGACGSSGQKAGSTASTNPSTARSGANVAAAKAGVAAFSGKPSAFPVTQPLRKPLPAGAKFVYLQASDPVGALLANLIKPAVSAIGGKFVAISAGNSASSAQAAASSAVADHPAVVLIPAFLPSEFGDELHALRSEGAKIVGAGMAGAQRYGIQACINCDAANARVARLMADWAVANKGAKTDAVFYNVPELDFTAQTMWPAFQAEIARLCPKCVTRDVPIDVSTIGTTAPQKVVNDLQSHPGTNVAVFSAMDIAQGLPAAESAAGLGNVLTIGGSPTPENLVDMKAGKLTAGIGEDLEVLSWSMVDAGARLTIGQPLQPTEGLGPIQLLTDKDITFDTSQGWSGYPDFAQRFAKLWHPNR